MKVFGDVMEMVCSGRRLSLPLGLVGFVPRERRVAFLPRHAAQERSFRVIKPLDQTHGVTETG